MVHRIRTVRGRCMRLAESVGLTKATARGRNVALSFSHVSSNVIIRQLNATKKLVNVKLNLSQLIRNHQAIYLSGRRGP